MRHLWFQQALAAPVLGPRLAGGGAQRLPRHLFSHGVADHRAEPPADVELYLAALREPARARAASLMYRQHGLPEFMRILAGRYRKTKLRPPHLLVFGSEDSVFTPDFLTELLVNHERYAEHIEVASLEDASHYLSDETPEDLLSVALGFLSRQG